MKTRINKKFLKDLSKIPSHKRKRIEKFVFQELPEVHSINEIKKAERLKGFPNHYKIRFGNYRLGFQYKKSGLILKRVLHRKDIYRFYP